MPRRQTVRQRQPDLAPRARLRPANPQWRINRNKRIRAHARRVQREEPRDDLLIGWGALA